MSVKPIISTQCFDLNATIERYFRSFLKIFYSDLLLYVFLEASDLRLLSNTAAINCMTLLASMTYREESTTTDTRTANQQQVLACRSGASTSLVHKVTTRPYFAFVKK